MAQLSMTSKSASLCKCLYAANGDFICPAATGVAAQSKDTQKKEKPKRNDAVAPPAPRTAASTLQNNQFTMSGFNGFNDTSAFAQVSGKEPFCANAGACGGLPPLM